MKFIPITICSLLLAETAIFNNPVNYDSKIQVEELSSGCYEECSDEYDSCKKACKRNNEGDYYRNCLGSCKHDYEVCRNDCKN